MPGAWPITTPSMFELMTTNCGVTPHPQKTGTSPSRMTGASPYSGLWMSVMPSFSTASHP